MSESTRPDATLLQGLLDDQAARWQRGDTVQVEHYLARRPQLHGDVEAVLDLILNETLLRRQRGETPRLDEYLRRFPQWADQLYPLFEVERAIEGETFVTDTFHPQPSIPPTLPTASSPSAPPPPEVPGYEVLGVLGHGSMGVVWKARHRKLDRLVALKLLRAPSAGDPDKLAEQLRRQRQEAEAVARLQHADIVQIFELGECNGLPYLALEYVPGGSLGRKLAGIPQPPQQAAALLERLARALHAAHQAGVLHRDLKPDNILLTQGGSPKISDFGLAKRLDTAAPAQSTGGALAGTPSYMAPEQAEGLSREVGVPADVYGLGAVLYELLTGRPPFRAAGLLETLEQVKSAEPVPPRRLNPAVPADLETICLKCLRKEPAKRYASAALLADDLQRFREHRPIEARPVGRLERAGKWVRRRPAAAALIGVSVTTLLALAVGIGYHTVRLQTALDMAEDLRKQREEQARRAETSEQQMARMLDELLRWVATQPPARDAKVEQARRDILERALALSEELLREKAIDPVARQRSAWALGRRAEIYRLLGRPAQAEKSNEQALQIQSELVDEFPTVDSYRRDLAGTLHNQGILFAKQGRWPEAEKAARRALDLNARLAGDDPANPHYRRVLADNYTHLGIVLARTGRLREAATAYRKALELQDQVIAERPQSRVSRRALALSHNNLGHLLHNTGQGALAEKELRKALQMQEKLLAEQPDDADLLEDQAGSYYNLCMALVGMNRLEEGEKVLRRSIALRERLARAYPGRPHYRAQLAEGLDDQCNLMWFLQPSQAEPIHRQALAVYEKLIATFPTEARHRKTLARRQDRLLNILVGAGRLAEAERSVRRTQALYEKLAGEFPAVSDWRTYQGELLDRLADIQVRQGKHAEAAASAAQRLRLAPDGWAAYRQAAGVLARCVSLAERDPLLPEPRRRKVADGHAAGALALLRQAVGKGFRDLARLGRDADLQALRGRDDFRKLLAGPK